MGVLLNPKNTKFQQSLNSEIYVDMSGMIKFTNKYMNTEQKYLCISRPRRFGKSMTLNMLAAYYSFGCSSKSQFENLEIAQSEDFEKNLNKYNVIFINMQEFLSNSNNMDEMLDLLKRRILRELKQEFSEYDIYIEDGLTFCMYDIYHQTEKQFVILIDEWDCIFREHKHDKTSQEKYLDFLRDWLKDKDYVALAYMTGILPIKKYGTHSALNMFTEYSMIDAEPLTRFVGFTENEVEKLCRKYNMDLDEMRYWYDGYKLNNSEHIYSPRSVVTAINKNNFNNYWTETETYEALKVYITMNFDGLHDTVERLLAGEKEQINIRSFTNDMVTFECRDDVLTLLVHLGYLGYNSDTKEVFIPNKEIRDEYFTAMSVSGLWKEAIDAVKGSKQLLKDTWSLDSDAVARAIEKIHQENVSVLQYNDENALSYIVSLAYYAAKKYYYIVRELPSGKGFADIAFIHRNDNGEYPAMIVELKQNKSADTAIEQIKRKEYESALKDCKNILLVGISYDKESKKHACIIKKVKKIS